MFRRHILLALSALAIVSSSVTVRAAGLPDTPVGAEAMFVASVQADLMKRFPTAAAAQRAGFFRYTGEDNTGAISYTNGQWQTTDVRKPTQLWYDVNGKLLGVDFSVLRAPDAKPPLMWGVRPERWQKFPDHMHYIEKKPDGSILYNDLATKEYVAAGGDPEHPTADPLVKAGKVQDAAAVTRVFRAPAIWDLIFWVKPNPSGAFADKNPLVKPSKNAAASAM